MKPRKIKIEIIFNRQKYFLQKTVTFKNYLPTDQDMVVELHKPRITRNSLVHLGVPPEMRKTKIESHEKNN